MNDYQKETDQYKRGFPDGHVSLERILAVPIITGSRVAAIGAVANKGYEYTTEDAELAIYNFLISILLDRLIECPKKMILFKLHVYR